MLPVRRGPLTSAVAAALALAVLLAGPALPELPGGATAPGPIGPPLHPLDRSAVPLVGPLAPHLAAAAGGESTIYVTTSDPNASGEAGVETNITEFPGHTLPTGDALQLAVEETIGRHDALLGIFETGATRPTPFFEVFNASTDAVERLDYATSTYLPSGSGALIALALTSSTTWTASLNGGPLGPPANDSFDFGPGANRSIGGPTFSAVAFGLVDEVLPSNVTTTLAFAVDRPGGWYLPERANASYVGSASQAFGVAGTDQVPTLGPGELVVGRQVPSLANASSLWSGGPVPIDLALSVPLGPIYGSGLAPFEAVASEAGRPLPALPLAASDALGGAIDEPFGATGSNGSATATLRAANVSVRSTDRLTVRSTLFGLPGEVNASFEIEPAPEVLLAPSSAHLTLPYRGSSTLTLTARFVGGAPAGSLLLLVTSDGPISVAPDPVLSGTDGVAVVTIVSTGGSGSFPITVNVTSPGYWGHLGLVAQVDAAPSTLADLELVGLVAGAAAVAVAIALVLRGRRRRRRGIEPFDAQLA